MIAENIGKYILSYVTIDKSGYTKAVLKVMRLEKYNVSDEPMYAQLVFNQELMKMNLGRVFTVEEARMAFQTVIMQNASEPQLGVYKVYIGENDEEYIGMGATCWNEEYSAVEIEYMLLPQYWNRGYGTALVKNLVHMAVTWKSGTNVIAITDPANICSQRILQKNGFVLIKQYLNQDGEAALLYQKSIGGSWPEFVEVCMLDDKGFNLWADGYDQTVGVSDEENTYPFAGYREVLGTVYRIVMEKPQAAVLDIGFGTGVLTAKLYEHGCTVYGQDFSSRMMELAAEKMPEAHLFQGDFSQGLAEPLRGQSYDFIVATYSLHHLTDGQKIDFLRKLQSQLNENGRIVIGDVAFETRAELDQCRQQAGSEWDEEEIYFVADELREFFPNLSFTQISYCAGVLVLAR